jgi:hypothetical protein
MPGFESIQNMKKGFRHRSFFKTSPKEKLFLLIVLSTIAAIYFLTLSVNHNEAEDSLHYLSSISYGPLSEQFNPDHLLYNFINYIFFHLWRLLGYEGNAEFLAKFINIIAALSVLWLLYIIASKLKFPVFLKYFCIISVTFSYGFWWYSVECETYIIPIIFILLCFHRLILIRENFFNLANHLFLGAFNALAILFHKQHTLLVVIIFLGYILIFYENQKKITWKKFISMIIIYTAVCGFTVLLSYLLVAVFIQGYFKFNDIANWAMHLSAISEDIGWHIYDFPKGVIGFCRNFIGGHYIFYFSMFSELLKRTIPSSFTLKWEIFLIKDFSILKIIFLYVLTLTEFFLVLYIIFQIIKNRSLRLIRSSESDLSHLSSFMIIILAGYFLVYSLFNVFFTRPQILEVWISLGPIVFLILGLLTIPLIHKTRIRISLGIMLLCLFLINLFGSVLPQTDREHDYYYKLNSWLIENCKPGDLVVSGLDYFSDGYVRFYSGARIFSFIESGPTVEEKFREIVALYKPKKIYFTSIVYPPFKEYKGRRLDISSAEKLLSKLSKYFALVHSDSYQKIFLYKKDISDQL